MSIGDEAKKARLERGMTLKQLASTIGSTHSMLSMVEAGEEDGSDDLKGRLRAWIQSGQGPRQLAPRGPYKSGATKARKTIKDPEE